MKKLFVLLAVMAVFCFTGCSGLIEKNDSSLAVTMPGGFSRAAFNGDLYWFEVSITPAVESPKKAFPGETVYFKDLPSGEYTVEVAGFTERRPTVQEGKGTDLEKWEIFRGQKTANISAGSKNVPVQITFVQNELLKETLVTLTGYSADYKSILSGIYPSLEAAFEYINDQYESLSDEEAQANAYTVSLSVIGNITLAEEISVPKYTNVSIDFNNYTVFLKNFESSKTVTSFFRADTTSSVLCISNATIVAGDQLMDKNLFRYGTILNLNSVKVNGFNSKVATVYGGGGFGVFESCKFINCNVVREKGDTTYTTNSGSDNYFNAVFQLRNCNAVFDSTLVENCISDYQSTINFTKTNTEESSIPSVYFYDATVQVNKKTNFPLLYVSGNTTLSDVNVKAYFLGSYFYSPISVKNGSQSPSAVVRFCKNSAVKFVPASEGINIPSYDSKNFKIETVESSIDENTTIKADNPEATDVLIEEGAECTGLDIVITD